MPRVRNRPADGAEPDPGVAGRPALAGGERRRPRRVEAVEESAVVLEVAGATEAVLRATPERLRELAAGHLRVRGRIHTRSDLESVEVVPGERVVGATEAAPASAVVRVVLAASAPRPSPHPRDPVHALGCAECRARLSSGSAPLPDPAAFPELFRELYARGVRYGETGGVHSAGLVRGGALVEAVEDVSRHSAVDKLVGFMVLEDRSAGELGLLLSARISGEIAWKAARAGLAWVASRSVPTTLAVAVAEAARLPLLARAGRPEARRFGSGV